MKRLFDEDMSMDEFKKMIRKLKKKESCNNFVFLIAGLLVITAIGAFVFMKINKCGLFAGNKGCCCDEEDCDDDCMEQCECDENGCTYTDEDDFVE